MSCNYVNERRLYEYADGHLTGTTLRHITEHLSTCPACDRTVNEFRLLADRLSGDTTERTSCTYDPWAHVATPDEPPDWLLTAIADAVVLRDGARISDLIGKELERLVAITPEEPRAAVLVGYLALWMNMGFGHIGSSIGFSYVDLLGTILRRLPRRPRLDTPLVDFAYWRLAEGLLALQLERYRLAASRLRLVTQLAAGLNDVNLLSLSCGALAKVQSRRGRYSSALKCVDRAIATARAGGYDELAAVFELRKAWILFQLRGAAGDDVIPLVKRAEAVLQETRDHVSRGNCPAALGKFAAHQGHYDEALRHYDRALSMYAQGDGKHPRLARALVNRAQTRLFVGIRLRRLQRDDTARLFGQLSVACTPDTRGGNGDPVPQLQADAEIDLKAAEEIYSSVHDVRGCGSVLLVRALLHLTRGEFDQANLKAANAFDIAVETQDLILLTRARIQQCRVANAWAATERTTGMTSTRLERAHVFGEEAVFLAERTQHRRLIATAWIWRGLTLSHAYFEDRSEAATCLREARRVLDGQTRDYVWDELRMLERLVETPSAGPTASEVAPLWEGA